MNQGMKILWEELSRQMEKENPNASAWHGVPIFSHVCQHWVFAV